jgi:hypothetical protein
MIGLLRAAAQAGSFVLNTLRTQPVNLLGGPSFDEIFDEPAASFWADEQPLIDQGGGADDHDSLQMAALKPAAAEANPITIDDLYVTAVEFVLAAYIGDWAGVAAAADKFTAQSDQIAQLIIGAFNPSSADGEARSDSSGPPAEECPASGPVPRAGAGHPNLTRDELMDLANAAGHMRNSVGVAATEQHWADLQRRLEDAAIAAPS